MTDYVTLTGYEVIRASEKAVCIRKSETAGKGVWLPRSLVQDGDDVDVGDTGICVPDWKADEEGLDTD